MCFSHSLSVMRECIAVTCLLPRPWLLDTTQSRYRSQKTRARSQNSAVCLLLSDDLRKTIRSQKAGTVSAILGERISSSRAEDESQHCGLALGAVIGSTTAWPGFWPCSGTAHTQPSMNTAAAGTFRSTLAICGVQRWSAIDLTVYRNQYNWFSELI